MSILDLLLALAKAVIWVGGWSQLLGLPLAWWRVRRTAAWVELPAGDRRIDVLADFTFRPTWLAIFWAWLVFVLVALGDFQLSTAEWIVAIWGPPTVFVPWAVLRLDSDRFATLVEERRLRRAGRAAAEAATEDERI